MLDPSANPYTPGAGQRPAVLSGRQQERDDFDVRLQRLERGRSAQCTLVVGLRGVGKTVLLNQFAKQAQEREWVVVEHEVTTRGDLIATVARLARQALLELVPRGSAWARTANRVAAVLRSIELTYKIAGLSLSLPTSEEPERVGSGDPAQDVTDLLVALGGAAQERGRGVAMVFDELQFAPVEPLGALVAALHKVAQRDLPLTAVAAGLPQTRGVLAEAASYSERMFETRTVGALDREAAARALAVPARDEGVTFTRQALETAVHFTEGYPFFLQVFGDRVWRLASGDRISGADARTAEPLVQAWLDEGFFTFRTDRLPASQRRYLRAMAEIGSAEVSSGEVAAALGLASSAATGQTRDALIRRGLIYSPRLGYASFTVPQFAGYLERHYELEPHVPRRRDEGAM